MTWEVGLELTFFEGNVRTNLMTYKWVIINWKFV